MSSKVSLVVPAFNEGSEVKNFFNDLKKCDFDLINEIIIVNDCSTDNTLELLKEKINEVNGLPPQINFLVINNQKNRGYGFSIKRGIESSKNDIIAIIDLDRTYKIEDLNNITREFINNNQFQYDLISGERNINTSNTSVLKIIGKFIVNFVANFCFNEKIIDYNSGLRIFNKKKFLKHSHIMSNRFSLTTSMTITFLSENYDIKFIKIKYEERSGKSKLGFKDFFKFMYTIISLLFYYKPYKVIMPLFIPLFLTFIFFLMKDIKAMDVTDKTVMLFNSNFLIILLLFLVDRINKLK